MENREEIKLDKLFGPSGSFGGIILLITGLAALYYSISALLLVVLGAFAAFTTTCTTIDYGTRRVRYATSHFGLFKSGKWIDVTDSMSLRVRQSGRSYRAYSRSNRSLDINVRDYTIVLRDARGREVCPLQRLGNRSDADIRCHQLADKLSLAIKGEAPHHG
jgi:hypothetical protein